MIRYRAEALAQYMEALRADTRNERSESASADFHELRQDFSPPNPVGQSAIYTRIQSVFILNLPNQKGLRENLRGLLLTSHFPLLTSHRLTLLTAAFAPFP